LTGRANFVIVSSEGASVNGKGAGSRCDVPDLAIDIVAPLRAGGHADDTIRALGEVGI